MNVFEKYFIQILYPAFYTKGTKNHFYRRV